MFLEKASNILPLYLVKAKVPRTDCEGLFVLGRCIGTYGRTAGSPILFPASSEDNLRTSSHRLRVWFLLTPYYTRLRFFPAATSHNAHLHLNQRALQITGLTHSRTAARLSIFIIHPIFQKYLCANVKIVHRLFVHFYSSALSFLSRS